MKLVLVIIPATSFLYFGFAYIFDLPAAVLVLAVSAFIAMVLGLCITYSSRQYEVSGAAYDGQIVVTTPEDGPKLFSLQIDGDLEKLDQKASIRFKVVPQEAPFEDDF